MAALIEARGLGRCFAHGPRWWPGEQRRNLAVEDVSLSLTPGVSLGLVGESGCGKSTLARMLVGLDRPTAGNLLWQGQSAACFSGADWRRCWRQVQYVFQEAHSALNPRHTLRRILAAPLVSLLKLSPDQRRQRVDELLDQVGLTPKLRNRYPHQLSGGQAQRVVLARALAVAPSGLILDEPVSALDVSIQAQIVALLRELRDELGLTYLFISHNLAVVEQLCDEVMVMKAGRVVETGGCDEVFSNPRARYTQALIKAVPRLPV